MRHNTQITKQAVGGWPPRYAPAPLLPLWALKRLAPPSIAQRSSSFPRPIRSHAHHCSRLMLLGAVSKADWWHWPLTFWPWKWFPSHVWRALPLFQF